MTLEAVKLIARAVLMGGTLLCLNVSMLSTAWSHLHLDTFEMASARTTTAITAIMVTKSDKEMAGECFLLFFSGSRWCCNG